MLTTRDILEHLGQLKEVYVLWGLIADKVLDTPLRYEDATRKGRLDAAWAKRHDKTARDAIRQKNKKILIACRLRRRFRLCKRRVRGIRYVKNHP